MATGDFNKSEANDKLWEYAGKVKEEDVQAILGKEEKLKGTFLKNGVLKKYWTDACDIFSLLKDRFTGAYTEMPWRVIAALVGALLYVLSPLDLVPDLIPLFGFVDDAFVFGLAIKFAQADLERYRAWKRGQGTAVVSTPLLGGMRNEEEDEAKEEDNTFESDLAVSEGAEQDQGLRFGEVADPSSRPAIMIDDEYILFPCIPFTFQDIKGYYYFDWDDLSSISVSTDDDGTEWLDMDVEVGVRVSAPLEDVLIDGDLEQLRTKCAGTSLSQFKKLLKNGVERIEEGEGKEVFTEWSELLHFAAEYCQDLQPERRVLVDVRGLLACCEDLGNYIGSVLKELSFGMVLHGGEILEKPVFRDYIQYGIPLVTFLDSVLSKYVTAELVPDKGTRTKTRNNMKKRAADIATIVPHLPPELQEKVKHDPFYENE